MNALLDTDFSANGGKNTSRTTEGMDYRFKKEEGYDIHCVDCEGFFSDKIRKAIKKRTL